jgi:predicted TIM-barrel fold metal-dependent hydrolase
MKQGFKIMDCDIHVTEPADLWINHMDAFRDRAPKRTNLPGGADHGVWTFEGKVFPAEMDQPDRLRLAEVRGEKARRRHIATGRYADKAEDLHGDNPKSMLKAMDREGVDVAIVFRTLASHFIAIDGLDPKLSAAVCRGFNNWLGEFCDVDRKRLKPAAILPMHDVELAVEEARRCVRDIGAVAFVLSNHPVNSKQWYDHVYDPLWQEAERARIPVTFHGIQMAYQKHLGRRFMDNFAMVHAVAHPVETMLTLGSLLTGGVFERYPGLRVGFLEAHASWVPSWLWALDERVEKFNDDSQFPLKMPPSEYFKRQCFVAVDPDESLVRHTIEAVGDDNIVISTDWPHDDSAYPIAMETFIKTEGVSDGSKRKILWDNCARLYGLN